jgi:hypothetical protein
LACADRLNPVPTHAYELVGCEYTVYMPSVYGCPLECPVANRALCGGQGHCAYDPDKKAARCYCNKGYRGDDCTNVGTVEEDALNYSPALLGLIITLFIIVALLVLGVFTMIKQVSAFRDDIANYQVLKGGDEDNGGAGSTPRRGGGGSGSGFGSGGNDNESFSNTMGEIFSPVTDLVKNITGQATSYLGNRAAARSAAANHSGNASRSANQFQNMSSASSAQPMSEQGDVSSVTL